MSHGTMLFYNCKLIADKKDNLSYLVLEDETDQNKNTNMQVWNLKDEEASWQLTKQDQVHAMRGRVERMEGNDKSSAIIWNGQAEYSVETKAEDKIQKGDEVVVFYSETYTKDGIFEKKLLMLLPFYIMRYEKDIHEMSENPELFQCLLNEYEEIRINLVKELSGADKAALYMDLNKLIIKIADYICQSEEVVRKGIGDVMGGKVLELESERLRAEGKAIGEVEGEARGEERLSVLINRLILDGRSTEIQSVVTNAEIRKQMYKEYGI